MKVKLIFFVLTLFWVFKLSSQTYTQESVPYVWNDISATGSLISGVNTDNGGFSKVIPFTFNYFGADYTSCYINANGLIVFNSTSTSYDNQCFPDGNAPNDCIAGYWDDLYYQKTCGASVTWRYTTLGASPNRVFVVSWINFRHQTGGCGSYVNMQVKLYETTNVIEVHLKSNALPINNSATIGIENSDGTVGYHAICNEVTTDGTAWRWTPSTVCDLPEDAGDISGTSSVCQGESSIAYSVPPITDADTYVWSYSGTGATINGTTNSVTIDFASNATSGNLTVLGTNSCGDGTASANYGISLSSLPSASGIISGTSSVCQGESGIAYSVGAISGATSYTWSYSGTGATINGTTNSVTIDFASNATSGNLTVLGTNSCGDGTVSANYGISLSSLPSASGIISGTSSVCQGESGIAYSVGAISGATSYTWSYSGTGATINGTSNSITIDFASNATSGNLIVQGTNSCGDGTASANYGITVSSLPSASGIISGTSSVCQGESGIAYSVGAISGATSYTWSYSGTGATINGTTNSVTIDFASNATSGNLTVLGTNSCGDGTASANYGITVSSLPSASGIISGTSLVCQGESGIAYSVGAISGATSYTWSYSGTGATINGTSNSITIDFASNATSGNLTVQGTNSCGDGTISANYGISLSSLPSASGIISGTSSVCQGESGIAYSVGAISGATSYTWSYSGTGATINGTSNSITIDFASNATSGNLTVQGTNSCGDGTVSANYGINVNGIPSNAGLILGSTLVCEGQSSVSYSLSAITGATSYVWTYSGTGATINGTSNSVAIDFASNATSGNLTVYGTNSCGDGVSSANFGVSVNSIPADAGLISGISTVCQDESGVGYSVGAVSGATSYTWTYSGIGATISGTGNNITISFANNATSGNLIVKGKNTCGFGNESIAFPITVNPLPSSAGIISGTSKICAGQTGVSYSVTAIPNAVDYVWSYSGLGETINGNTNSITMDFASNATSGQVKVRGQNACGLGSLSSAYSVTVTSDVPDAVGSISGADTLCAGESSLYTVGIVPRAETYHWSYSGIGGTFSTSSINSALVLTDDATSGTISVYCTNVCGVGVASPDFEVVVNPLPDNANGISGESIVCAGQTSVEYSVPTAANVDTYYWIYSGNGVTINGNTENITLDFASNATTGTLIVQSQNNCGVGVFSSPISITVSPSVPIITINPSNLLKCIGNTATFNVVASGIDKHYQWYKDGNSILGATSATYSFTIGSINDEGGYYCEVTNICGTVSSGTAILDINSPEIVVQPISQTRCPGDTVSFSVSALGTALSYQWYKNGVLMSGKTQPNLSLNSLTSGDSGDYTCKVSTSCGNIISDVAELKVNQLGIQTHPESEITCANDNVTFSVLATGYNITYQWKKDGSEILGETSNEITLFSVSEDDEGIYTCEIQNECSLITSNEATLTLNTPEIITQPLTLVKCPGTSAQFKVIAEGSGLAYQWYKNEVQIVNATNSTYNIGAVSDLYTGQYFCIVSNLCGIVYSDTVSLINNFPVITIDPISQSACLGDNLSFVVGATAETALSYQWLKDGIDIAGQSNDVLEFSSVLDGDEGEYVCEVSNSCGVVSSIEVQLSINNIVFNSQPLSQNVCDGDNVLLNVDVSGSGLSYQWQYNGLPLSGENTNTLSLSSVDITNTGIYSCEMSNICGIENSNNAVINISNPIISLMSGLTSCQGFISCSASGGVSPYEYSWSHGEATATILNVDIGNYYITVTDSYGCSINDSIEILNHPTVVIQSTSTNATCYGICDGTASIIASGGLSPYTFLWSENAGSSISDNVNNLCAGEYFVTVNDGNLCPSVSQVTISEPEEFSLNTIISNSDCSLSNGSIIINTIGGTLPYSYNWSSGYSNNPIFGISGGSYIVTISDVNGCDTVLTYFVNTNDQPILSFNSVNTSCNGICDGNASLFVTGGTSPYNYLWSTLDISTNISDLCSDWYSVTVTDAVGCEVVDSVFVNQPDSISISFNVVDVLCSGENNGSVQAEISGGTSPYSYLWSNEILSDYNDGLTAGLYYITVQDNSGCSKIDSVQLGTPNEISVNIISTSTDCGNSNGILEAIVSGGVFPYNYEWSNGVYVNPNIALNAGVYGLTVTDANNCSYTIEDTVFTNNAPTANITITNNLCYAECSGIAEINITGGTSPYDIIWSNDAVSTSVSDLCSGIYYVTISDFLGCTFVDSLEITQPDSINFDFNVTDASCYSFDDGAIDFTLFGGASPYDILWSNDSTIEDLENISAGTYFVTVTDNNSCLKTDSIRVYEPINIAPFVIGSDTVCDSETTLSLSTAYISYQWMLNGVDIFGANNSTVITDSSGIYSVKVSDGYCNGESNSHVLTVINVETPTILANDFVCSGASIILSVNDIYDSYIWKVNGIIIGGADSDSIVVSSAGNYTVEAFISNCSKSSVIKTISLINTPVITSQPIGLQKCPGQSANFTVLASGTGISYQWYMNDVIIDGATSNLLSKTNILALDSGYYFCRISNICDTIYSDTVNLSINVVTILSQPQSVVACQGDTINFALDAIGDDITYKWIKNNDYMTGQTQNAITLYNISSSDIADYKCQITSSCGSVFSSLATLALNNLYIITNPVNKTGCEGDSVGFSVSASGVGLNYQWTFNDSNIIGANSNKYSIPYIINTLSGSYFCIVENMCGIDTSNAAFLTVYTTNIINQPISQLKCIGNSVQFKTTATGPSLTYQWFKNGVDIPNELSNVLALNSISQNDLGYYFCQIGNSCGDTVMTDSASLSLNNLAILTNPVSTEKCMGDSVYFAIAAEGENITYQWKKTGSNLTLSVDDTLKISQISTSSEAGYYCKLTTTCGSLFSTEAFLDVHNLNYVFNTVRDTDSLCVGTIHIMPVDITEQYSYQWNNLTLDTSDYITNLCSQFYTVTITDSLGCVAIDSIYIGNYLTSILSVNNNFNVHIYPNPVSDGYINFGVENNFEPIQIVISDIVGKQLINQRFENYLSDKKIDLKNFPTGVYFLRLVIGEKYDNVFKIVVDN